MPDADDELVQQFKLIAGISQDDAVDGKVALLLHVHNNNVNDALSTYFDSQFTSISDQSHSPPLDAPSDGEPPRRRLSSMHSTRPQSIHSLFMLESMVPRLARAPTISDSWRLDLARAELLAMNAAGGSSAEKRDTKPKYNSLLIWLLILPRRLWLLVCTLLGYFSGINLISEHASTKFDPKKYDQLDIMSRIKNDEKDKRLREASPNTADVSESDGKNRRRCSTNSEDGDTSQVSGQFSLEKEAISTKSPNVSVLDQYNITTSDFNAVHRRAQNSYSWLLIMLLQSDESSSKFLSSILHDEQFHRTFNKGSGQEPDTIIYAATPESDPQAWAVARAFRARKFPCVVLVGNVLPIPHEILLLMLIAAKLVLVLDTHSGENVSPMVEAMLASFKKQALDPYSPQLVAARFDKREQEYARLLKQQQDDAYSQSLVQDRVKREAKNLAAQRQCFLRDMATNQWGPVSKLDERKVRLAVKVPNGSRIVLTVPESATVSEIYMLAELEIYRAQAEPDISTKLDGTVCIENYYQLFPPKFELVQPFPKKIIPWLLKPVRESVELKSGANLIVEMDSESDEDL